jgi:Tfp pilus assembly protein PilX
MRKGVVLAIVMGIALVLAALALIALYVMTNEAHIAEHKIRRMRAMYAAQGAMVHALELLRTGGTSVANRNAIAGANPDINIGGTNVDLTITPTPGNTPSDFTVNATVSY